MLSSVAILLRRFLRPIHPFLCALETGCRLRPSFGIAVICAFSGLLGYAQYDPLPMPSWRSVPVLTGSSPSDAGLDSVYLYTTVDSLIGSAIEARAFPGCQLLVARGGKIIMDRCYGWHDYSQSVAVENDHLYDLASITKVAASTLAIMKLTEQRYLFLDKPFSEYYPPFRTTDKRYITLREMMTHQAGFPSGIPMLRLMKSDAIEAQKDEKKKKKWEELDYNQDCFSTIPTPLYPVELYTGMYLNGKYLEMLFDEIRDTELKSTVYRYSDLPFLLFPGVVEEATGKEFDRYLQEQFYGPMGLGLRFNPAGAVEPEKIVPTEKDETFRHATIHGYVHDESAAICGGVAGNAGLFGNARDLAVIMQMLLNGGIYDGKRYLNASTIEEFTRTQYPENKNRRALGFDKPYPQNGSLSIDDAYPAPGVSQSSYGHSGFTGTFVWADPEYELIYILLTNRVNPTRDNRAFSRSRVRYRVQQAVYDSMRLYEEKQATDAGDTAGPLISE